LLGVPSLPSFFFFRRSWVVYICSIMAYGSVVVNLLFGIFSRQIVIF